ncbi:MAG: vitamin K epoxide reductase family protein [Dehalococcoidia bacterium]|nr:vitamin K epoxide reductase family protein [Dehalococcoidia bacterium]
MMPRRRDVLLLLALLGVGIAAYLTYVAINDRVEPLCSGLGDCHTVQQSQYAKVAGIPVAAFGLAMYLALAAVLVARRVGPWREDSARSAPAAGVAALLPVWTFALALGGTLYSAYLTYLELAVIDAICEWCVASAVTVALICVLSAPDVRRAAAARRG